jgi:hypothetical protein
MCGPGMPHEMETCLVDGRIYRVYKNLPSSMREFWLSSVSQYSEKTYIVFEGERLTYGQGENLFLAFRPPMILTSRS